MFQVYNINTEIAWKVVRFQGLKLVITEMICTVINRWARNPKYDHYVSDWLYSPPKVRNAFLWYIYEGTCVEKLRMKVNIAYLRQESHNSKFVIIQQEILKVLKCYNFRWVQRRHNCSPAASFANCVMTLYLLKVHLQTFISVPITQKRPILSCDTLVANEMYVPRLNQEQWKVRKVKT